MKSKLDSEGRISLPRSIQQNLGIQPGDSICIELTESGVLITPVCQDNSSQTESIMVLGNSGKEKPKYFTVKGASKNR